MKRNYSKKKTYELLKKFRKEVPDIAIRTTLLVGFPGESEQDFEELKQFVQDIRFERLGVFTYSEEEDTYAGDHLQDNVPEKVKQNRANEIMDIQQQISYEINQEKIGKTFKVLIDKENEEYYIGRTQYDSPEVDNEVLIEKNIKLNKGEFYTVKINNAEEFDLYGTLVR